MSLGLGLLRHASADFWSMTPRELACAATAHGWTQVLAPDRRALDELMFLFPDDGRTR